MLEPQGWITISIFVFGLRFHLFGIENVTSSSIPREDIGCQTWLLQRSSCRDAFTDRKEKVVLCLSNFDLSITNYLLAEKWLDITSHCNRLYIRGSYIEARIEMSTKLFLRILVIVIWKFCIVWEREKEELMSSSPFPPCSPHKSLHLHFPAWEFLFDRSQSVE